jgi:hypothetical protein
MELIADATLMELIGVALFSLAVLHTFSTKHFEHLAHTNQAHAGLWHLLGEVEAVFGFWAFILLVSMGILAGFPSIEHYLEEARFIEPMFVMAIMVIAASRPVLQAITDTTERAGRALPLPPGVARYFLALFLVPLLGSFVTEPAAMTLGALMLREIIFSRNASNLLKYVTLGTLFVNVSIGGTMDHFAAPPILMVAAKWHWGVAYVFSILGWKAIIAAFINAAVVTLLFYRELAEKASTEFQSQGERVPALFVLLNLALLAGVVVTNHTPEMFMGLFLLFLGFAEAYKRYHDRLIIREALMVSLFLAGLVVLGGYQEWWLQTTLSSLSETTVYYGAALLTAITDNAALTYLGSLVDGLSDEFKYSLVAGAVTGGGLTVIANAPNPAGFAILKNSFDEESISSLRLFLAALPPTIVVVLCFQLLPHLNLRGLDEWALWLSSLDRNFLFLLALPILVAVVGVLSAVKAANRSFAMLTILAVTFVSILGILSYREVNMEFLDLGEWAEWFSTLDRSFLFLLVLPLVVAIVGLWRERIDAQAELSANSDSAEMDGHKQAA